MKSSATRSDSKRQNTGVVRRMRRWGQVTVHLTLACLLQMIAGEAWAEELQRGALVRKAHGEPSVFSTIADWLPDEIPPIPSFLKGGTGKPGFTELLLSSPPLGKEGTEGRISSRLATSVPPLPEPPSGFAPLSPSFGTPPWRLLSVPDEPTSVDPADVLSTIAADFTLAYAYDACDPVAPWRVYDPADVAASDLTAVDHRIGFWLKGTDPNPLAVSGVEPAETSIRLCPGWNLIGYPLAQDRPVLAALSSIIGKFLRVYGFDPDDEVEPWKVYDVDVPDWANTLRVMERGMGYWIYAVEETTLVMRNVGPPPEVEITSPKDGSAATFRTEVAGTVRSDLLERWELAYRLRGEAEWIVFASGDAPVEAGNLGLFDPTLLLNGLYEIRLEATDFGGQSASTAVDVAVEGNAKIGQFTLSFVDLDVTVLGLPIQVLRTYDSRDKRTGDFGVGWQLSLSDVRVQESGATGLDWQGTRSGLVIPTYCVRPTDDHLVTVTLPDDSVLRFRPTPEPECQPAVPPQVVDISYQQLAGLPATLRPLDQGTRLLVVGSFPGPAQLWDQLTARPFDPDVYELTFRDGRSLVIVQDVGLQSITDASGNRLSVGPEGITHSSGQGIAFERDGEGRIIRATDPEGRSLIYAYNDAGDLATVTDRNGGVTRFTYGDDHFLEDIENPEGVRAVRTEYDDDGRMIRTIDANGHVVEFDHDLDARREVMTNRLGDTRILEYDARGNISREVDESGAVTVTVWDDRDNMLSQTDPLGRVRSFEYNEQGDVVRETDPLGRTTEMSYGLRGELLSVTDSLGRTTGFEYDERHNLTRKVDAAGNEIRYTWDSRGAMLSATDALGHTTAWTYDRDGNVLRETDPLGNEVRYTYDRNGNRLTESRTRTLPDGTTENLVTRFTYDANDQRIAIELPDGSVRRTEYDLLGRVVAEIDELGRATRFEYDARGRLRRTTYPDGTTEQRTWDAEGRPASFTDRAGRTTHLTFDSVDRLVATTYPDGAVEGITYDAVGQPIAVTDPRGNTTRSVFNDLGQRLRLVNALDQETTFTYDGARRIATFTDPRGQTLRYSYDELDRLVELTLPTGRSFQWAFDAGGRRVSETDPNGDVTVYDYDDADRLTGVTDPLGRRWTYAYDELGQQTAVTDPNGHVTRFEHDVRGRRTARVLPDGARETWVWRPDGTLESHTDFSGRTTTFTHDVHGRLLGRSLPDGTAVSITYTPTGQPATVTDVRGTTRFEYDARDRLVTKTEPNGWQLSYAYDLAGNRTRLTATVGATVLTTTYTYDALNRIATLTDPQGGLYAYAYDPGGNRLALSYPNGVASAFEYDAASRLESLTTRTELGQVLQRHTYSLDAEGKRLQVDEDDGTARSYTFDASDRLTEDRVADGEGALVYQRSFAYDPAGNRLSQTQEEGGAAVTVSFAYDDRDRLLGETPGATYSWDDNGNLTAVSPGLQIDWDAEDRLRNITLSDGTEVRTDYDAEGNRVRREVLAPDGSSDAMSFLVDTAGPLSHVVAEITAGGQAETFYVRGGDELLALHRPASGTTRYVHADGLGSVRVLSDPAGGVTDRYSYRAFGDLLEHLGSSQNPYRFAGEPVDPTMGFSYHRARWLDTSTGRFLSMDPFRGDLSQPLTLHDYLYANLDPVNLTDPTGERFFLVVGIVILALVALHGLLNGGLATIFGTRRKMTAGEIALADTVFLGDINYDKVRIFKTRFAIYHPSDTVMAPNGNIYYHPNATGSVAYSTDFSQEGFASRATFIHELTHVWQHQKGIWVRTRRVLLLEKEYGYVLDVNRRFEDYGIEEMGSLVADYYRLLNGRRPVRSTGGPTDICSYEEVIPWVPSCP